MTETTYDEYRAAIAAQTQRDRDRFLGIDSRTPEVRAEHAEWYRQMWAFWLAQHGVFTVTPEEVGVQVSLDGGDTWKAKPNSPKLA